jgi:hypothetical protein
MNHDLHYFPLGGDYDLFPQNFASFYELLEFIEVTITSKRSVDEVVFIFSDDEEVFVTSDPSMVFHTLNSLKTYFDLESESTIFLQEYSSYEEAYEVALEWKENNKLCFNKSDIKLFKTFAN